jgi:hypothetical protein
MASISRDSRFVRKPSANDRDFLRRFVHPTDESISYAITQVAYRGRIKELNQPVYSTLPEQAFNIMKWLGGTEARDSPLDFAPGVHENL